MSDTPAKEFPRLLRRAWALADARSESPRLCDALEQPTPHRRLETSHGAYWICGQSGQMTREITPGNLRTIYDTRWEHKIATRPPTEKDLAECGKWLNRVEGYRKTGRLFEVGSGAGLFLKKAAEAGWRAEGNDISQVAADHAMKSAGVRVIVGPMENVRLDASAYDAILCNNVFEHFSQPHAALSELARALRPGGVIFFQTLSAQSLSLYFQPRGWLYFDEGHLHIPTLASLQHYFRRSELDPIHFETHGFRSSATPIGEHARRQRVVYDKLMAGIAARVNRGHRVKYLLRRRG